MSGDSANTGRPAYPLTDKERTYLSEGDSGSYRESVIEDRIQKKVDDLGDRIDHLLSDIELLSDEGYLNQENWGNGWIEFLGFTKSDLRPSDSRRQPSDFTWENKDPDHADIIDACTHEPKPDWPLPTSSVGQLGFEVGRMLEQLMLYPEGIDEEQMAMEVAWGLADGYLRGNRPWHAALGDERRDLKEAFIEFQRDRLEQEMEFDEELVRRHEEYQKNSDQWPLVRDEMIDCIRGILHDAGLPIASRYDRKALNETLDDYYNVTTENGIHGREVLDLLIDHLVETSDKIDNDPLVSDVPGSAGELVLFERQYGPLGELDPESVVEKEDVLTIVSENHLVEKAKLSSHAEDDMEAIDEAHWHNVEAADVVREVATQDGKLRSEEIADILGEGNNRDAVTKLCTDLAGRVFERAVLAGDNTGWELTPYGEILVNEAFGAGVSGRLGALNLGVENPSLIDAAAEQIGVVRWQYSRKD